MTESKLKLNFVTVDVFTTTSYAGNPLAIIEVPASAKDILTQSKKQDIAKEFNLSETVFLHLPAPGTSSADRTMDIFTIQSELPFAGHPTIGTSHYLIHTTSQKVTSVITKAGRIPISIDAATQNVQAEIPHDFAHHEVTFRSKLNQIDNPITSIVKGMTFVLVSLPDLPTLARATNTLGEDSVDVSTLTKGWDVGFAGILYFAAQGVDEFGRRKYRTRMQADWVEDPGTGSASGALACYLALAERESGPGPFKYAFVQGVEMGRPNHISVEVTRTPE